MTLGRQIILGLGLFAALAGWYFLTQARLAAARHAAETANAQVTTLESALAAARKDQRIVTRYVDRVHTIRTRGQDILQKVPVYVPTPSSPAACAVPRGFVRVYNAAAQGTDLPARPSSAHAAPSGLALADVARGTVDNFTTCHAIAQQLTDLQAWVRQHQPPPDT